jgi:hypothetical protein
MSWLVRLLKFLRDEFGPAYHPPEVDDTACAPIRRFTCPKPRCGRWMQVPAEVTWCMKCGTKMSPE